MNNVSSKLPQLKGIIEWIYGNNREDLADVSSLTIETTNTFQTQRSKRDLRKKGGRVENGCGGREKKE